MSPDQLAALLARLVADLYGQLIAAQSENTALRTRVAELEATSPTSASDCATRIT